MAKYIRVREQGESNVNLMNTHLKQIRRTYTLYINTVHTQQIRCAYSFSHSKPEGASLHGFPGVVGLVINHPEKNTTMKKKNRTVRHWPRDAPQLGTEHGIGSRAVWVDPSLLQVGRKYPESDEGGELGHKGMYPDSYRRGNIAA